MPRNHRIEYENSFHHVMSRGYLKQVIFFDHDDFEYFLKLLANLHQKYSCIIHSFCLMNNHFHLLLQNPSNNLKKAMHWLLMKYARYYNKKYQTRGKVFESRYLSPVIDTESYLTTVSKYIHRNPLELVNNDLNEWEWSSYRYYCNKDLCNPAFLETKVLMKKFNNSLNRFIAFTEESSQWSPRHERFSDTIFGSEKFIREVTLKHIDPQVNTDIKDSYSLNWLYRNRLKNLQSFIKSLSSNLRLNNYLLVYALRLKSNLSFKEISKRFFESKIPPTTLCEQIRRLKSKSKSDNEIHNLLCKIEDF